MNLRLLIFSALLSVLCVVWNLFVDAPFQSHLAIYIVIYFMISTGITHYLLIQTNKKSPKNFIRAYIGLTALRLLLNLLIILVVILVAKNSALAFTLTFLVFYFFYLIFEIVFLKRSLSGSEANK